MGLDGSSPHIADLNGDGRLDVLVTRLVNDSPTGFQVYLGDGTGHLEAHTTVSTPSTVGALFDVDADGDLDAIGGGSAGPLLWRNSGDGTFAEAEPYSTPGILEDLDGDGDLDLVQGVHQDGGPNALIYRNDGGTFTHVQTIYDPDITKTFSLALIDTDGVRFEGQVSEIVDGASGEGTTVLTDSGRILFADVDGGGSYTANIVSNPAPGAEPYLGSISPVITQPMGGQPGTVDWTFTVNDSALDFLAAGQQVVQRYTLTIEDGAGGTATETMEITLTGANDAPVVQAATPDLAFSRDTGIYISPNDGTGTFGVPVSQSPPAGFNNDFAVGDVDGDLRPDIVVASLGTPAGVGHILRNEGDGSFSTGAFQFSTPVPHDVDLADIDRDGDLDAIFVSSAVNGNTDIYKNNGAGAFTLAQSIGGARDIDIAMGDLNGDGYVDAYLSAFSGDPNRVLLNDGTGAFSVSSQPLTVATETYDPQMADLDADGDLDVAVADAAGGFHVLLNDGTGQLTPSGLITGDASDAGTVGITLGDVDGDDDIDVITNSATNSRLWRNDGLGSFSMAAAMTAVIATVGGHNALADIDADGDLDLAKVNGGLSGTNSTTIYLNTDGNFAPSQTISAAVNAVPIGFIDVDGVSGAAPENVGAGVILARISASDANSALAAVPFLIAGGDPDGLFEIDDSGNISLVDGKSLDYEQAQVHNLTITVTDVHGAQTAANATIRVSDVDDADIITGTASANLLRGGVGNDQISGLAGNDDMFGGAGVDIMFGGAGDDALRGGGGDDMLYGQAGDDRLTGGPGMDTIDGGDGDTDRVDYRREQEGGGLSGVTVNLQTGAATDAFGDFDILTGIERVRGTDFVDVLTGSGTLAAVETFEGLGGNDTVDGQGGNDRIAYHNDHFFGATSGIDLNLQLGTATGAFSGTDTLSGIEIVSGSAFGDTITGDEFDNIFEGNGGTDSLNGAGGFDIASYRLEHERASDVDETIFGTQGIVANLADGTVTDTYGTLDTLFEHRGDRGLRLGRPHRR